MFRHILAFFKNSNRIEKKELSQQNKHMGSTQICPGFHLCLVYQAHFLTLPYDYVKYPAHKLERTTQLWSIGGTLQQQQELKENASALQCSFDYDCHIDTMLQADLEF